MPDPASSSPKKKTAKKKTARGDSPSRLKSSRPKTSRSTKKHLTAKKIAAEKAKARAAAGPVETVDAAIQCALPWLMHAPKCWVGAASSSSYAELPRSNYFAVSPPNTPAAAPEAPSEATSVAETDATPEEMAELENENELLRAELEALRLELEEGGTALDDEVTTADVGVQATLPWRSHCLLGPMKANAWEQPTGGLLLPATATPAGDLNSSDAAPAAPVPVQ